MIASSVLCDEALLDRLQSAAFHYFLHTCNIENGLVADTARANAPASIAVVGFTLSSYPVAVERGWLTRTSAAARTHFLGMRSGADETFGRLGNVAVTRGSMS